jgi:restriction system protein
MSSACPRHQDVTSFRNCARFDPYGGTDLDRWKKEVSKFISRHIQPSLSVKACSVLQENITEVHDLIETRVLAGTRAQPAFQAFSESMTPNEFEHFCAEQLRKVGWLARVTQQSGDQGVDVVAEKDGVRVVLQCKLYTGSVGNDAVQQIVAGRLHERAHYAIVVSNRDYTPAARQLASTTGVRIINYIDLQDVDKILGLKR